MTAHERLRPGKYRLRVEDYERLVETGVFGEARTELIEGEVIVLTPQFRPHGIVKMDLYDQLREMLRAQGSSFRPVVEFSLALSPENMPDPDIMLTSEPRGPRAVPRESVPLVIEVSDTTLADDLGVKLRLYARFGVPEYWVADVNARVIHRMWSPSVDRFESSDEVMFGEPIASATIDGLTIKTDML
jgi:Uma2 family endonuclease